MKTEKIALLSLFKPNGLTGIITTQLHIMTKTTSKSIKMTLMARDTLHF